MIEIPEGQYEEGDIPGKPCWIPTSTREGQKLKPIIRCNCGKLVGLGNHAVAADGTVTASFYHSQGTNSAIGEDPDGCGWHVWLKLTGWNNGAFPVG